MNLLLENGLKSGQRIITFCSCTYLLKKMYWIMVKNHRLIYVKNLWFFVPFQSIIVHILPYNVLDTQGWSQRGWGQGGSCPLPLTDSGGGARPLPMRFLACSQFDKKCFQINCMYPLFKVFQGIKVFIVAQYVKKRNCNDINFVL